MQSVSAHELDKEYELLVNQESLVIFFMLVWWGEHCPDAQCANVYLDVHLVTFLCRYSINIFYREMPVFDY